MSVYPGLHKKDYFLSVILINALTVPAMNTFDSQFVKDDFSLFLIPLPGDTCTYPTDKSSACFTSRRGKDLTTENKGYLPNTKVNTIESSLPAGFKHLSAALSCFSRYKLPYLVGSRN